MAGSGKSSSGVCEARVGGGGRGGSDRVCLLLQAPAHTDTQTHTCTSARTSCMCALRWQLTKERRAPLIFRFTATAPLFPDALPVVRVAAQQRGVVVMAVSYTCNTAQIQLATSTPPNIFSLSTSLFPSLSSTPPLGRLPHLFSLPQV